MTNNNNNNNNNNNKEYYGKPCLSNVCYTIFNSSVSKLYHVKIEIKFQIIIIN